jgi:deoxyribonuclease-2
MNLSALDETGNPVDWWFIYKVPKLGSGISDTDSTTGYEYVYFDANLDAAGQKIAKSANLLGGDGKGGQIGALDRTLASVFADHQSAEPTTGWILYNDEYPDRVGKSDVGSFGHTKGVICYDTSTNTAFWLLHSWPKFADPLQTHEPTPIYGQTFVCLSLDLDSARQLAAQMIQHQEPQVYEPRVAAGLPADDPLVALTTAVNVNAAADSNVIDLATRGGPGDQVKPMPFKVIAKNRRWNKDFWNGLVGPALGEDMDVETWIRGPIPPIADSDGIHKTFDITYITLGPLGLHWAWPESQDHAKWGITMKSDWVCVDDINRMISQRQRGGCTIAFQNETLWNALTKTSLVLAPPGHNRTEAHAVIDAAKVPKPKHGSGGQNS